MFDRFASPEISDLEGALLFWYAKNTLLFDIECRDGILMVRYEELVRNPISGFKRIFRLMNCRFRRLFVQDVHPKSVNPAPLAGVNLDLLESCEQLLQRLHRHAGATVQ